MRPALDPDQHGTRAVRRSGRPARGARLGPARGRRRSTSSSASRSTTTGSAHHPARPPDAALGVLQRRGFRRAPDQGRRGSPAHPPGGTAQEPGQSRGRVPKLIGTAGSALAPGIPPPPNAMTPNRRLVSWLIVTCLTASLTSYTAVQALRRYHELRTGWSWDLGLLQPVVLGPDPVRRTDLRASLCLLRGRRALGLEDELPGTDPAGARPVLLDPSRSPYLAPDPEPRVLVGHSGGLHAGLRESQSEAIAVSAAALVPFTPLLWPLVWNDFRELQLAIPFVLWAVQGIRGRQLGLTAAGITGMLACRQEFAVMVATFAFLPAREPEDLSRTLKWRQVLFTLGLAWLFFGFFGYLRFVVASACPASSSTSSPVPGRRCSRRWRRPWTCLPLGWAPGRSSRVWLRAWRSWQCRGSGACATAGGPSGSWKPRNGITSATPCCHWPWSLRRG